MLIKVQSTPYSGRKSIFNANFRGEDIHNDMMIPVIYQPAIDSWINFVREIHCYKINSNEFEVTILFNNEHLREHAILNPIYEWFRSLFYGRVIDVESFRVKLMKKVPEDFEFTGIYSGENKISKDDVHGDKVRPYEKVPIHKIKYYFVNAHTNHDIWKWEYICWEKDSPVVFGKKSREEINKSFRPKIQI